MWEHCKGKGLCCVRLNYSVITGSYPLHCIQVDYLCGHHKPTVQVAKTTLTVGRAFLPRAADRHVKLVMGNRKTDIEILSNPLYCKTGVAELDVR